MFLGKGITALVATIFLVALSAVATAQGRITLETPGASDGMREDLQAASLVFQTQAERITDPTALLAAAQADYARLLAVLYERGHFAGVITIKVNGREAAAYTALARLPTIREIRLRVDPGPVYRFGAARVAPLPGNARPPFTFRPGALASTEVIRDAAVNAVCSISRCSGAMMSSVITMTRGCRSTGAINSPARAITSWPTMMS